MRTILSVLLLSALPLVAADEFCPAKWTYPEDSRWGDKCAASVPGQSPINITERKHNPSLNRLAFSYTAHMPLPVSVKNTGRDIKISPLFEGKLNLLDANDNVVRSARLVQFHFHVGAEHVIDIWRGAKAELHLVHELPTRGLVVVAVPIVIGEMNPALQNVLNLAPAGECQSKSSAKESEFVWMKFLLPAEVRRYLAYTGSLTSPPCSGGVEFILMNDGITANQDQIDRLQAKIGMKNARTVQTNGVPSVTYRGHLDP